MILLLKPVMLAFVKSDSVKKLIIDCIKKLVQSTDNEIDEKLVNLLEIAMFPIKKEEWNALRYLLWHR